MWMQYSAQGWPLNEDLKSGIQRIACELRDLSFHTEHATNYDLSVCFDDDAIHRLSEDSNKFNCGANLCNKYCQGFLNLEEFCELMHRINLTEFLHEIGKYLPDYLIEQYQLQPLQEEDNDEEK